MATDEQNLREPVKEVRRQLGIGREDLARELGISFATANRWENGKSKPSKPAGTQFDSFCTKMTRQKRLTLPGDDKWPKRKIELSPALKK